MVTGAAATVTRQASGGGRQRGSQGALRLLVAHRAARGRRRRRESPGCLGGVRAAAGQPRMENRAVKVRPAYLAHRAARDPAAGHPRWKANETRRNIRPNGGGGAIDIHMYAYTRTVGGKFAYF